MVDEVFVLTLNIPLCVFVIVFLCINDSVFLFVFLSLFWSFQMFTFCTMSSPLFYDSVCLSHWTLFFLVPDFLVWLHPSSSLSVSFTLSLSLSIYLYLFLSLIHFSFLVLTRNAKKFVLLDLLSTKYSASKETKFARKVFNSTVTEMCYAKSIVVMPLKTF
jgi:hypothetical protein